MLIVVPEARHYDYCNKTQLDEVADKLMKLLSSSPNHDLGLGLDTDLSVYLPIWNSNKDKLDVDHDDINSTSCSTH